MTNKEARELNSKLLEIFIAQHIPYQYWDGDTIKAKLTDIVDALEQLGYRLIDPDKLKVIGDEEIQELIIEYQYLHAHDLHMRIAQAQLDYVKRQLRGELDGR